MDEHKSFKDLLKSMFEIDPRKRISCREALRSNFFYEKSCC